MKQLNPEDPRMIALRAELEALLTAHQEIGVQILLNKQAYAALVAKADRLFGRDAYEAAA